MHLYECKSLFLECSLCDYWVGIITYLEISLFLYFISTLIWIKSNITDFLGMLALLS